MTISTKWIRMGNIACAVLLLALLALQMFQPFWTMPACTCTEQCTIAKTLQEDDKIDMTCPACKGYADVKVKTALWCSQRPITTQLEAKEISNRDTTKEWKITIQQYVWMPTFTNTKGVTEYFSSIYNGRSIDNAEFERIAALEKQEAENSNSTDPTTYKTDYKFMVKDIVLMPVIVFFFGLIGIYLGIAKSKNPLISLFPLVTGIWVVKDYLTVHIFRQGDFWQVHMGIGIALIVFALIPTVAYLLRAFHWMYPKFAEKKAAKAQAAAEQAAKQVNA